MIVFDLKCEDSGDVFEGWFSCGSDFDEQARRGLVQCPACRSTRIVKAPMAPGVPAKGREPSALDRLAAAQAAALRESEWVGDRFAEEARAIHHGESKARPVHGNATAAEAKSLIEEGVPVAPLPLPVLPPNQVN